MWDIKITNAEEVKVWAEAVVGTGKFKALSKGEQKVIAEAIVNGSSGEVSADASGIEEEVEYKKELEAAKGRLAEVERRNATLEKANVQLLAEVSGLKKALSDASNTPSPSASKPEKATGVGGGGDWMEEF